MSQNTSPDAAPGPPARTRLSRVPPHRVYSCGICGYRFSDKWMVAQPWIMAAHMDLVHDRVEGERVPLKMIDKVAKGGPDVETSARLTKMLEDLHEATKEARAAAVEANQARKDFTTVLRVERERIASEVRVTIDREVKAAMSTLEGSADRELTAVVQRIERSWREALRSISPSS